MRAMGAAELLDAWERALGQPPARRALAILAAADGQSIEALARLSIGQRDAQLLSLREKTFGPVITAVARCPRCNEDLELHFHVDEVRMDSSGAGEPCVVIAEGYEVVFRMPNTLDMCAASSLSEVGAARQLLLERCVLSAACDGAALSPGDVPESVFTAVTERMAEVDPQAEVLLDLVCEVCGHVWQAQFDIAAFFWHELNAWAQRALREVHQLARFYGWREADILQMSALRRQIYLQMAGRP